MQGKDQLLAGFCLVQDLAHGLYTGVMRDHFINVILKANAAGPETNEQETKAQQYPVGAAVLLEIVENM
ncbi:hypothetical protein D9M68_683810 [compost metagenome]